MENPRNNEIRKTIKESKLYFYEVAEKLNIHENTLFRMLRRDLSTKQEDAILSAIKELIESKRIR
ncbi:hypothetical protein [Ornithinibacillus contaminans]|uniref:hypothetical protein n=1 Tax=Ornithinibacillus contaminans TaxID=694055 RepID=UPI00064DE95E|nr:hypothetical protein [Ornithinibacillus contaminans]